MNENNNLEYAGVSLRILENWVVIDQLDSEYVSDGGILMVGKFIKPKLEGVVRALGPGRWSEKICPDCNELFRIPMSVKKGDHVMFEEQTGYIQNIRGKEFLWIRESEIHTVAGSVPVPA